jgi:hypothetical protein
VREVKKIWVGLTPVYIQSLYNSIPRRIRSVIVAKGHITKYWKWQICSKINLKNIFPIFPYAYIPQVMRWRPSWWNNYGHLLYCGRLTTMYFKYYSWNFKYTRIGVVLQNDKLTTRSLPLHFLKIKNQKLKIMFKYLYCCQFSKSRYFNAHFWNRCQKNSQCKFLYSSLPLGNF